VGLETGRVRAPTLRRPVRADSVLELIGGTPVVRLNRIVNPRDATVWAKLESFNPGWSVKDRISLSMIEAAEEEGLLEPGSTVVEATSGNTGIGLALVCAVKGYRLILTMPNDASLERRRILRAYGAEILLTPRPQGMSGAIEAAEDILERHPEYFATRQFQNPANPAMHRRTTAREILEQLPRPLDAIVVGVGTGGTLTGVGEVLRERNPDLYIVAVEPSDSAVLSGGDPGPHRIEGLGAGIVPTVLNIDLIDRVIAVTTEEARAATRRLAREEGILAGISAGANIHAAMLVARELGRGKALLVVVPDTGERYLSTDLFE
jgi:cysteine synthase A